MSSFFTCNTLSINNLWHDLQKTVNHLPICRLSSSNSPSFTMRFSTFCDTPCSRSVSRCKLRTAESLNYEGEVRETTLIRRPKQKVVFGLSPGLYLKNKFTGQAKIRQETPQVKNLWKRLRNWKGSKSMAFGDDPYGKNYALCAVAGNMVNLKL